MNIDIYLSKKVLKVKDRVISHGIKSVKEDKITFFTEIYCISHNIYKKYND